jgi:hypothetical protein
MVTDSVAALSNQVADSDLIAARLTATRTGMQPGGFQRVAVQLAKVVELARARARAFRAAAVFLAVHLETSAIWVAVSARREKSAAQAEPGESPCAAIPLVA